MEYFKHIEIEGKTFVLAKDVAKHFGKKNTCDFVKCHFSDIRKVDRKLFIEKTQVEEYIQRKSKTELRRSKQLEKYFQEMYETRVKNIEEYYKKEFEKKVAEMEERFHSLAKSYQCRMQITTRFSDLTIDDIWYHIRECPCSTEPVRFEDEIKKEIEKIKAIKWYNPHAE